MNIEQIELEPVPEPFKPVRITLHSQAEVNSMSLLLGRVAGSGMAAKLLKELFEELRQFDRLPGMDLGLALAAFGSPIILDSSADKALGFIK